MVSDGDKQSESGVRWELIKGKLAAKSRVGIDRAYTALAALVRSKPS